MLSQALDLRRANSSGGVRAKAAFVSVNMGQIRPENTCFVLFFVSEIQAARWSLYTCLSFPPLQPPAASLQPREKQRGKGEVNWGSLAPRRRTAPTGPDALVEVGLSPGTGENGS